MSAYEPRFDKVSGSLYFMAPRPVRHVSDCLPRTLNQRTSVNDAAGGGVPLLLFQLFLEPFHLFLLGSSYSLVFLSLESARLYVKSITGKTVATNIPGVQLFLGLLITTDQTLQLVLFPILVSLLLLFL